MQHPNGPERPNRPRWLLPRQRQPHGSVTTPPATDPGSRFARLGKFGSPREVRNPLNLLKSRTVAVVAGSVVLVALGAGGAAVADGLIGSADIRDNSVRSVDLRDGGVAWPDLRDGVRDRIDAPGPAGPAGAKGEKGDTGPRGDTGMQGSQGARGSAGTDGSNGTNGFSGYEVVSGSEVVFNNTWNRISATAGCPSGKVAIGGGAQSTNGDYMYMHASYPSDRTTSNGITSASSWTVEGEGYNGSMQPYAVCVSPGQ